VFIYLPFLIREASRLTQFWPYLGTGGTIAGIGKYLKDMDESILVVLSDPEGSGLHNKVGRCSRIWLEKIISEASLL
jgi:cysteine synthase